MASQCKRSCKQSQKGDVCPFCARRCDSNSEECFILGETRAINDLRIHHFCLLLSSNLAQNGQDDEGIDGFLLKDIQGELKRGRKLKCSYCGEKGATIGCSLKMCKKVFHLPCGLENGAQTWLFDTYPCFCRDHRDNQTIPPFEKGPVPCVYCSEQIEDTRASETIIVTPCCRRSFHSFCLKKAAAVAGMHHFSCAHCRNVDGFQEELKKQGVFIPDRDATWQTEHGAYESLYVVYEHCDAPQCMCPTGRDTNSRRDPKWKVVRCSHCGSSATHVKCADLENADSSWLCAVCSQLEKPPEQAESASRVVSEPPDRRSKNRRQSNVIIRDLMFLRRMKRKSSKPQTVVVYSSTKKPSIQKKKRLAHSNRSV